MEITYTESPNPLTEKRKWHITCDECEMIQFIYAFGHLELWRLPKEIRDIGVKALVMSNKSDVPFLEECMDNESLKTLVKALKSVRSDNSLPMVTEAAQASLKSGHITQEQCDAAISRCRALHETKLKD